VTHRRRVPASWPPAHSSSPTGSGSPGTASPNWARRAMALARELGEAFLDPDDR